MDPRQHEHTISHYIWDSKYRCCEQGGLVDQNIEASWQRIAKTLAQAENSRPQHWSQQFYKALEDFRFLPGGRIQAGVGCTHTATLFNCFVMGHIEDSPDGISQALKEGALTMQQGGGIGYDFSSLRPQGAPGHSGTISVGPLSCMQRMDNMCTTMISTKARRGAMMATLRCDHPDIELFIDAKSDANALRNFNLSVQVSDAFMRAVFADDVWPLVFPITPEAPDADDEIVERTWPGEDGVVRCRVYRHVSARALWTQIMYTAYAVAEPGVLFIDRINEMNNLYYREQLSATNPCGEVPLPPYGACNLGSINLSQFVRQPFTDKACADLDAIANITAIAIRMLDNVTSLSGFPLDQQREAAQGARRIGLGITALADCLIMLGLRYDSEAGRAMASSIMQTICHAAYRASITLARERGAFPYFEKDRYLDGAFIKTLPEDIRQGIAKDGIRNSHLTAIAPTGTISLLANNVSSGIEPVFSIHQQRFIRIDHKQHEHFELEDYAHHMWRQIREHDAPLPDYFVCATEILPIDHLKMQAALQPYVDSAISKTINIPADTGFADFGNLYDTAYALGLKGCTVYKPHRARDAILTAEADKRFCCSIEREPD